MSWISSAWKRNETWSKDRLGLNDAKRAAEKAERDALQRDYEASRLTELAKMQQEMLQREQAKTLEKTQLLTQKTEQARQMQTEGLAMSDINKVKKQRERERVLPIALSKLAGLSGFRKTLGHGG